jgi:hypothetical protein
MAARGTEASMGSVNLLEFWTIGIGFAMFLPFLASLFGRDARWQAISLGLGMVTLFWLLNSHDVLALLSWLGACLFVGAAIWARVRAK